MTGYDVRRLLLLRTVAEAGSLSTAAAALSFTTSAVSQQIAKLEKEVGLPLLERQPRGVALTEAGRCLVAHAGRIDDILAAASEDMAEFAGLRRGSLIVGVFPTVGSSLVPPFVTTFREAHPGLTMTVRSQRRDALLDHLVRHEVDLALLWDYPWARLDVPELAVGTLLVEESVVLLPRGHRYAGRAAIELPALADEEWIIRADAHPVADVLHRICRQAGFEPRVAFAANDYQETQGMVAARIGIALAPQLAVLGHREDVVPVRLAGDPAPRRILVAHPPNKARSRPIREAVASLRAAAEGLGWRSRGGSAARGR